MKLVRFVAILCLLWLWGSPLVYAAGDTPPVPARAPLEGTQPTEPTAVPPESAPPAVEEPTAPPVTSPPPVTEPPPQADTSPITITRENGPPPVVPTPAAPQSSQPSAPGQTLPAATAPPAPAATASGPPPLSEATSPSSSITSAGPQSTTQSSGPDSAPIDVNSPPTGASAPAQLRCGSREYPVSGPFLSPPFTGWAPINSFLDHDNPDYRLDGAIVLSNGLQATATGGQASDVFPSYWSPALRQYVSYDGHNGYDFGISYQPVLAAADGTVEFAGWNSASEYAGYGQMVLINHHNGYVTLYGHLSSLEVQTGDRVSAGEEIGISGTTGHSSGPHLHFSVFHNCQVTDPYGWTGKGRDPLTDFDGEQAAYLWLPGHDPLVLNSPPHWPAYPLGLKVALPPSVKQRRLSPRALPPVDRLLLLDLPEPSAQAGMTPGAALARTESLIHQEQLALAPYLDALKEHGVIESYQAIPAAAAVWVRGTATSAQLEGLPGVASLSGVEPKDVEAAQAGLAHGVLIQLGPQQAPSLWPVGFRSALHPWRPVITAVNGHALVEGFALPGEDVVVSLKRGNEVPAAAEANGDPETGGFVTMLHDQSGQPISVRPGDVVQVQTDGRNASVSVSPLVLRARARSISGLARPGATVPFVAITPTGSIAWRSAAVANSRGAFRSVLPSNLPAGSLAVATVTDAAGDQESASGFVPGMIVDLTDDTVQGWTVGRSPTLEIWRQGRRAYSRAIIPGDDGSFRLALRDSGAGAALRPGDVISIGSVWHRRRITVPQLNLALPVGARRATVGAPQGAKVFVSVNRAGSASLQRVVADRRGRGDLRLAGPIQVGDSATAVMLAPSGDSVQVTARVRGVLVRVGTSRVSGQAPPGGAVTLRLLSADGQRLGGATAWPDAETGWFSVRLRNPAGRKVKIAAGMRIEIGDAAGTVSATVPHLDLSLASAGTVSVTQSDNRRLNLTEVLKGKPEETRHIDTDAAGRATVKLRRWGHLAAVVLASEPLDGLTFERKLAIPRPSSHCSAPAGRGCAAARPRATARS